MPEIIPAELSVTDGVRCLTYSNRLVAESMQYQAMVLTTPDNVMKPFVLNERSHLANKEKQRFFKNVIIRVM
ncbi:hypothetical protein BTN50_1879 [Candidatus Enterovibrio altilux]|uniref:Uncharacterized protein n=1 Tax=Candidatus Enterovibrio altilux TaxID=1927128 RepID=A0A291BB93_9GAMM|nr:hypothetical protein BTN50_1879 [Candidatus Enterovibrio luxaltus]